MSVPKTLWIDNPSVSPPWNLASEEHLLTSKRDNIVMLWRNDRSVIIGRNQDLQGEVNLRFTEDHGIAVVRRLTGGGAVFHDLGNVNYTFITNNDERSEQLTFADFARPMVEALREMGAPAELSGRNDIVVEGKKVSGCAFTTMGDRSLFHGTLLFSADMSKLSGALRLHTEKIKPKGVASVAARVGNLADWLSTPEKPMDVEQFIATLRRILLRIDTFEPYAFTHEDTAIIDRLFREKYTNMAWTDGGWRRAQHVGRARCAAGGVETWIDVEQSRIVRARLTGDFMSMADVSGVENVLIGLPYDREAVNQALPGALLSAALCGITRDCLLDALFETNSE